MGAGVAKLKEQLEKVDVQLAVAALIPAERAELLAQKAAMEAELKAAQAMKSAHSAAAGAWCLFCSFPARPCCFSTPSPARPPRQNLTQNTLCRFSAPSLFAASASNEKQEAAKLHEPGANAVQAAEFSSMLDFLWPKSS